MLLHLFSELDRNESIKRKQQGNQLTFRFDSHVFAELTATGTTIKGTFDFTPNVESEHYGDLYDALARELEHWA